MDCITSEHHIAQDRLLHEGELLISNNVYLWPVEVDEGQMSQAISNLAINADQAMPEGGTVRIIAENMTMDTTSDLPLEPGTYIKISIKDQGIGIPKKYHEKIFDPFFTTKQAGSGLGLGIARSIIQKHGGHIAVQSELGSGSTFHIYLSASPEQIYISKNQEKKGLATARGKILVMDNEALIRELADKMLTSIGYEVTTAINGAEVVEMYRKSMKSRKPFDAVIIDSAISGDSERKNTIQKLIEIDPEVKAIISSSYAREPMMVKFREHGFRGAVTKPYIITELSRALHEIIS